MEDLRTQFEIMEKQIHFINESVDVPEKDFEKSLEWYNQKLEELFNEKNTTNNGQKTL